LNLPSKTSATLQQDPHDGQIALGRRQHRFMLAEASKSILGVNHCFNDQVTPPKWPFFGRKILLVDIMANLGYSAFVDLAA
jgi:hypothetical protein